MTMEVQIPGRVDSDYLDPSASDMAAALGLGEPCVVRRGRGHSCVYTVTPEQAEELARHLASRAHMLLGQSMCDPYDPFEKAERNTHRSALKTADNILNNVKRVC